ncbi:sulfite exporter TauE/SafE family protein [Tepidamorphus sp. 3E244]|uniref:sulfite exporter TauE/SafE family protein n=1 Tax=Tepidamorphus sp. 3E244 TaxID=3385498 RepID=UPI0038FCC2BB
MSLPEVTDFILAVFAEPRFVFAALVAFAAGLVRGFAGFGAAMIFMPLASSVVAPQTAAAGFLVMDTVLTLPLVAGALRHCQWHTVLPTALTAMAVVPFGAWVLAHGDELTLRWIISIVVLALLALLLSGWRYTREPGVAASVGVGAVAGFLSGVTQVSGPPVVAFWISGPAPSRTIRANLLVFFFLASISATVSFASHGFFTCDTLKLIVAMTPLFGLAIFLGARGFGRTSDTLYRRVAFALIAIAAITGLPLLDGLLR